MGLPTCLCSDSSSHAARRLSSLLSSPFEVTCPGPCLGWRLGSPESPDRALHVASSKVVSGCWAPRTSVLGWELRDFHGELGGPEHILVSRPLRPAQIPSQWEEHQRTGSSWLHHTSQSTPEPSPAPTHGSLVGEVGARWLRSERSFFFWLLLGLSNRNSAKPRVLFTVSWESC